MNTAEIYDLAEALAAVCECLCDWTDHAPDNQAGGLSTAAKRLSAEMCTLTRRLFVSGETAVSSLLPNEVLDDLAAQAAANNREIGEHAAHLIELALRAEAKAEGRRA